MSTFTPAQRAEYAERIHRYEHTAEWKARSMRYRQSMVRARTDRCVACHKPRVEDVHHISYRRAFTGREPDEDLVGMCHRCHMLVHELTRAPFHLDLLTATRRVIQQGTRVKQPRRRGGL
jgi:hypothetical protein